MVNFTQTWITASMSCKKFHMGKFFKTRNAGQFYCCETGKKSISWWQGKKLKFGYAYCVKYSSIYHNSATPKNDGNLCLKNHIFPPPCKHIELDVLNKQYTIIKLT